MKITTSYLVIRSSLQKMFVCNAHHGTYTKLLSAAQKFDTESEAKAALDRLTLKLEQQAHKATMDIGFTDESREAAYLQSELEKAQSFKIFHAERTFELKDEVTNERSI